MMGKLDKLKKNAASAQMTTREQLEKVELSMTRTASGAQHRRLALTAINLNPSNDYNTVDSEDSIRELSEDIKRNGLLHNLVVSVHDDGTNLLLSGERRLRALRLLAEDPEANKGGKYDKADCLCYFGLDELDEQIMLDAANLQVRGAGGEEKIVRKAMARYVDNLKEKYQISDAVAKKLLAKAASTVNPKTIARNWQLNAQLNDELTEFLDEGIITKYNALDFCACDQNGQEYIGAVIKRAQELQGAPTGLLVSRTVNGCVTAANCPTHPERRTALAEVERLLNEVWSKTEEKKPEQPKLNAVQQSRKKYITQLDKMSGTLHALSTPQKLKALKRQEAAGGEGSILDSLDGLIQEATALRQALVGDA